MRVIVDRINDGMITVELEDGKTAVMAVDIIPEAKEGDVIDITVNEPATKEIRSRIKEKMNRLWQD